jgi:integrase
MNSLRDALAQYVTLRKALGAKLTEPAHTLRQFVAFLERQGAAFITTELALRWAMKPKHVQHATWARRLSMVRRFALWRSATDVRTQVPPHRLIAARRERHSPHIFSDSEVKQVMAEASRLGSAKGLRAHTYTTLIGLLATSGLRPGEALTLANADTDLQNGILFIRETKFGKSRYVPIRESTRLALLRYAKRRDRLGRRLRGDTFFVDESGLPLQACTVRRTFARLSQATGLRPATGNRRIGRGPRLQDFRHTFATRKLIEWYRDGLDVVRELPKLATYLGHSEVAHTYWYISAVPELLQLATQYPFRRRPGGAK